MAGRGLRSGLLVPVNALAALVALLRLDRKRGDGAGVEALQADRLAGFLAKTVGALVDPLQRGVDLGDQLALAVARAQLDRAVGLRGSPVRVVRMIVAFRLERLESLPAFGQNLFPPDRQFRSKIVALTLIHERFALGRPA